MYLIRMWCLCIAMVPACLTCSAEDKPFDLCGVSVLDADPSAHTFVDVILQRLVQKSGTILVFTSMDPQVASRRAASADCAMGNGLQRWIVYDPEVIPSGAARDFALAHEIAHHMNRHLLSGDSHTKLQELEADKYAARYLVMLGWSQVRLLQALDGLKLPKESIGDYPSLEERRAAVNAGYEMTKASTALPETPGGGSAIDYPQKPLLLWSSFAHPPQPVEWNDCERPSSDKSAFGTSEESVWLYYAVKSGPSDGEGAVEWISPDGLLERRRPFKVPGSATRGCFRWYLNIRGHRVSSTPGLWVVRIVYDGVEIGRRTFDIEP